MCLFSGFYPYVEYELEPPRKKKKSHQQLTMVSEVSLLTIGHFLISLVFLLHPAGTLVTTSPHLHSINSHPFLCT